MSRLNMDIDVQSVSRWLVGVSLFVLALGFFREGFISAYGSETALKDLRQIALDTEHCLGSFYSSALMGFSTLLMISLGQQAYEKVRRAQWYVLALIFAVMSLDESVSFHEVLIEPLRPIFSFSSYLHFAWIVPGALFTLAVALAYLPFVFSFKPDIRNRIITAGGMYVTGALGLEAIGGHFNSLGGFDHPYYTAAFLVEESLEILGLTLFSTTLLKLLPEESESVRTAHPLIRVPAE